MKTKPCLLLLALPLLACTLFGIDTAPAPTATPRPVTIHSDPAGLQFWFDLAALPAPQSVQWVQLPAVPNPGSAPGPNDYVVIALLEYDQPTASFAASLALTEQPGLTLEPRFLEWLPADPRSHFVESPAGFTLQEGQVYTAGPLLNSLGYGYVLLTGRYVILYGGTR